MKNLNLPNVKLINSIILTIFLSGCLSNKYIVPTSNYAIIKGMEHRCENPLLKKDLLINDGKSIKIYKIDNSFTSLTKPIYETRVTPGTHKIFVDCYLGNKSWRVEKRDSIIITAVEGQIYYLDCSPASVSVSATPVVADFSYQNESEYLRMYDSTWLKSDEVARLIVPDEVRITTQGKKIELIPYLLNKKLKGMEVLPGKYVLIAEYSNGISYGYPTPIEWKAEPGHSYKIVAHKDVSRWHPEIYEVFNGAD